MSESFYGYYFSLRATACPGVDAILREVASAAKGYHYTEHWGDVDPEGGPSHVELIQEAADTTARSIADLERENAELRAALDTRSHDDLRQRLADGVRTIAELRRERDEQSVISECARKQRDAAQATIAELRAESEHAVQTIERYEPLTDSLPVAIGKLVDAAHERDELRARVEAVRRETVEEAARICDSFAALDPGYIATGTAIALSNSIRAIATQPPQAGADLLTFCRQTLSSAMTVIAHGQQAAMQRTQGGDWCPTCGQGWQCSARDAFMRRSLSEVIKAAELRVREEVRFDGAEGVSGG